MAGLVEHASALGRIPKGTLARLLVHDDPQICAAAALGEWQAEPQGKLRIDLLCDWRAAISRAQEDEYELGEVLKTRPALAHGWLRRAVTTSSKALLTFTPGHAVVKAAAALDHEHRLSVLRAVHPSSRHNSLVRLLVGDDLDLYRRFLADSELTRVHLWPLNGHPVGLWPEKAKLALAAGFSANEVAYAAYGDLLSWEVESLMWQEWAEQFAKLCSHEDTGVRAAAEVGREHAQKRREKALEEERLEAIYGRA
jgi:hypothetical protein